MRKNRINTTSIREIKHSFKRFLSLLVMSMLGVGVFVGIKMSAPDMMASLDKYYDDNNFYEVVISDYNQETVCFCLTIVAFTFN